ncbi:hypothetical protein AU253_18165 [Yersinia pestis]|nr:hypothetical protein AU253_18165 [Yersinia pestis]
MKTVVVNKDIIAHFVRLIMQCIDGWGETHHLSVQGSDVKLQTCSGLFSFCPDEYADLWAA